MILFLNLLLACSSAAVGLIAGYYAKRFFCRYFVNGEDNQPWG
jgi:hypothetical protein